MQGKTINGYTLKHLLGKGGMAEVWYAENSIEKAAAVKILREDFSHNPDIVERFRNEAKVMVKLSHANIRQVYDYGDIGGRPAIVMEYLEGDDLKAKMKKGERFGEQQLEKWWNQMADALNYTHGEGVVHRDIKPSNIFIDTKGNVRLLDFGIAKVADLSTGTLTGSTLGTRIYMSPEQVKDPKRVDYRTDVYSLAVTFVHLLTGKAPYDSTSSSDFEIQLSIVQQPLDLSALPAAWRSFLSPYLAKASGDRPALTHFETRKQQETRKENTVYDKHQNGWTQPADEGTVADNRVLVEPTRYSVVAKDKGDLKLIIAERIEKYGPNCDLNDIDVRKVTDMSQLFFLSKFNGDISKWNVSNVTNMRSMFSYSQFTGDISKWDVSKVTNMGGMFHYSPFNGDISKWDVSNVTNMRSMFSNSQFNGDISKWDVSNVTDMRFMFSYSQFTGDISKWDVSNVTDMSQMFEYSPFNGDISKWNVANVTDMHGMFSHSPFNDDISKWNVANVTNMGDMFSDSPFNGDISKWDVANVTDMRRMFRGSPLESRKPQWYKWYKGLFG